MFWLLRLPLLLAVSAPVVLVAFILRVWGCRGGGLAGSAGCGNCDGAAAGAQNTIDFSRQNSLSAIATISIKAKDAVASLLKSSSPSSHPHPETPRLPRGG